MMLFLGGNYYFSSLGGFRCSGVFFTEWVLFWAGSVHQQDGDDPRWQAPTYKSLKPRLYMAHFKRTRPGTEPGSVPGPVTRLFTLSGPGTAPTRSSTWPPSICATMQCVCSSLFLDFDDVAELRWPVCCDHENDNLCRIREFSAPFSRLTLAAVRGHSCIFVYWEKI